MNAITTHVLDLSRGKPASGMFVTLGRESSGGWEFIASGTTDENGRLNNFLPTGTPLTVGTYRLEFDTQSYFAAQKVQSFYQHVSITFFVLDEAQHYHVPLLLSPYGYSTYRGS